MRRLVRISQWRRAVLVAAAIVIGLIPAPVLAQPLTFFGQVGDAPVFVSIDRDGEKLSGSYFYLSQAKSIRLEGKVDPGGAFSMDEFSFTDGKRTGAFVGRAGVTDGWTGTWRAPGGRILAVNLQARSRSVDEAQHRLPLPGQSTRERIHLLAVCNLGGPKRPAEPPVVVERRPRRGRRAELLT